MQRALMAAVSVPSGILPKPWGWTPQTLQNWWEMTCLLKRYSVSFYSPLVRWNCSFGTKTSRKPFFEQWEQLHSSTVERSAVAVKRTAPQWQPPS